MNSHLSLARYLRRARVQQWHVTAAMVGVLMMMLLTLAMVPAHAKTPGSTYCFHGKCHRVKTIGETQALIGKAITLHASHYDACGRDRYNPCGLTSSGERFYPGRPDNAASPIYPDGTVLLVRNEATGATAVVRINNAGPYWGNRKLDVSYATAKKLGFLHAGVAKLNTVILSAPSKSESRYVSHRRYATVPGYIGKFKNLKEANRITAAIMAVEAMAGSVAALATGGVVSASRFETRAIEKQRARVAKKTKQLKTAMLGPELRWPDFATAAATPEAITNLQATGKTVVAQVLNKPSVGQQSPAQKPHLPVVVSTATQLAAQSVAPPTRVSRGANSLKTGEWLRPARPSIVLIRATDARSEIAHKRFNAGRLRFLSTLTHSQTSLIGRLSERSRSSTIRVASKWFEPGRRRVPRPYDWHPDARKAARHGVI